MSVDGSVASTLPYLLNTVPQRASPLFQSMISLYRTLLRVNPPFGVLFEQFLVASYKF